MVDEAMSKTMVKIFDDEGPHIYIRLPSERSKARGAISRSIDVTEALKLECDQTIRVDLDENGGLLSIEIF